MPLIKLKETVDFSIFMNIGKGTILKSHSYIVKPIFMKISLCSISFTQQKKVTSSLYVWEVNCVSFDDDGDGRGERNRTSRGVNALRRRHALKTQFGAQEFKFDVSIKFNHWTIAICGWYRCTQCALRIQTSSIDDDGDGQVSRPADCINWQ